MDLEFVQIQHRENVLKLMEICGLDMKEAYQLYVNSGYNFQAAVNRNFNPVPPPQQQQQQNPYSQFIANQQNLNFFDPPLPLGNQYEDDDEDYKYSQFKKFMAGGKSFDKKYPVRSHQSFFGRIIPKFFKGDSEDPFKAKLQKYIDKRTNLKNTIGNLSQVLDWSWKQKYPTLIIILDFSPQRKEDLRKIFSEDMFIQQVLNQQFKVYGINSSEYDLQEQLKPFFNLQRDANHLIVCRVNHLEEVQVMHRIQVSTPYEQLKKKLKMVKSQCIQVEMEESNIVKQYQEERRGNFNYKRPRTIKQNIKLKEDKKIRKQQEQQFFKAATKKQDKPPKSQIKKEAQPQQNKQQPKKQQPPKIIKPKISQQQIKQIRQQKFNSLKKYSTGLSFKIRVPSGQNIIINVDGEQKVQYLFDYVSFEPSDLGFGNDIEREFDIFVGFGGSERLKGKQQQQLKSLFQDSEVLIVRQVGE